MENPRKNGVSYEFGPFRVDAGQRLLFREGRPVPLAPKVVETLLALVERGGLLVTKDELMARLWPDAFVEESNLTQNVFLLRKALGEGADGTRYIETVPRRGYRFTGEIRYSPAVDGEELIVAKRTRTRIVQEEETTDPPRAATSVRSHTPAGAPRRTRLIVPAAVLTVLLIAGAFGVSRFIRSSRRQGPTTPPAPAPSMELKRLTYDSKAHDPAISPDDKYVAYRFHDGERESVRLRNIANGSTVEVMPPALEGYGNLAFSPDGGYLYFTTRRSGVKNSIIARAPVFGGTPQEVVREVWSSFALSPDGHQVAFFRGYSMGQDMRLLVADLNGGGERELIRSKPGELWFAIWGSGPAWSPDGRKIVALAGAKGQAGDYAYLLEVQAGDGSVREVSGARWRWASQAAWLPDGTGLVVSAQEKLGTPYQLWLVAYPSGEVRRLTNDLNDYDKISISSDSRLLIAQQETNVTHVWMVPGGDAARARQLTSGASDSDGMHGLAWAPDGRILFTSTRGGAYDIWVMKADGTDVRQLTVDTGGANWGPRATPDGRYIVFTSTRAGRQNVWRMDPDGNNPVRLTGGDGDEAAPSVSPDGRWVYYMNYAASPPAIEKVSIDGGGAVRVPNMYASNYPVVSPDGRMIAYEHYDDTNGWRTAVLPAEGGESPRLFDFHAFRGVTRWMPDSQSLIYIDDKRPENLWRQPLAGGPPRRFARFRGEGVAYFDLSPDGKQLVVARSNLYSDAVLITNFR
jgi:Tol biopolymer transport system component/DNA-binding winged helix-turn-helix (wHTH) protein